MGTGDTVSSDERAEEALAARFPVEWTVCIQGVSETYSKLKTIMDDSGLPRNSALDFPPFSGHP
jgi:hypothetical protein